MSLPKSYAEIAAKVSVKYCDGGGHKELVHTHRTGFVTIDGTVHWQERRVTRSGIRRFLMLAADCILDPSGVEEHPTWFRVWLTVWWVRWIARDHLHVVLPPSLWQEDKARLAALLVNVTERHNPEYAKALRWTRR